MAGRQTAKPKALMMKARSTQDMSDNLRERRIVMRPSDLGIDAKDAMRDLLSARTIEDLVVWSGGLYVPPLKFRACR
jgi:Malonate decarboxylase, alpha subunit, transporter